MRVLTLRELNRATPARELCAQTFLVDGVVGARQRAERE